MIETAFKQFVKNDNFRLIFFVLVSLLIPEPGFAQKFWNREYVLVTLHAQGNFIVITTAVYDYLYGPNSEHGYLENCTFEASVDNKEYFQLMVILTPWQKRIHLTTINFTKKLKEAVLIFSNETLARGEGLLWPEHLRRCLPIKVYNNGTRSAVGLIWRLEQKFKDVRYIRISGKWTVAGSFSQYFNNVVYNLNNPNQNALNSNTPDTITIEPEIEPVNILKVSEAIVIKGADPGANIKVYSKSGLEIKSVISVNDVVKIKLPANQIYIVHVGKSRYKVAL